MTRSNSGKDESRNNMKDPTIRDRAEQRARLSKRSHNAVADGRRSKKS
jgi:hypothetical protein